MGPLDSKQLEQFRVDGFTVLDEALDSQLLESLLEEFSRWVSQSRYHTKAYGEQMDGRPRFSLESGHSFSLPALRRVASPIEISKTFLQVMRDSIAVDAVSQILGPNIKFNNSKINSKYPGAATEVKFHQDFMFEPHSNDDLVTVLYFLNEVTLENGPLEIIPGSHLGPLYPHWDNGSFTGAVCPDIATEVRRGALACCGPAGTACLMNTRLLHGSAPNRSSTPRTLYIVEYCAEDSYPLQENHIPSRFAGELVRGKATNRVRCSSYEMEFPEFPSGASFFEQQAKRTI